MNKLPKLTIYICVAVVILRMLHVLYLFHVSKEGKEHRSILNLIREQKEITKVLMSNIKLVEDNSSKAIKVSIVKVKKDIINSIAVDKKFKRVYIHTSVIGNE